MARATFADPPVSSSSGNHTAPHANATPNESSRLKDHSYTPQTYTYVEDDLEAGTDGEDGREVEIWKPGKSGFYQTVSTGVRGGNTGNTGNTRLGQGLDE